MSWCNCSKMSEVLAGAHMYKLYRYIHAYEWISGYMDHPLFWFETKWNHVGRKPLSTGILTTIANNKIPCGVMGLEIFITFTNKNLEPHYQLARGFEVFTTPFAACSYVKKYIQHIYISIRNYKELSTSIFVYTYKRYRSSTSSLNIHLITPSLMRGKFRTFHGAESGFRGYSSFTHLMTRVFLPTAGRVFMPKKFARENTTNKLTQILLEN